MKKVISIILILLIFSSIILIQNPVYATSTVPKSNLGEITEKADGFLGLGGGGTNIKSENLQNMSDTIYNVLLTIGIILAFVVGAILGIKFLTGGLEGQADVKTALLPYFIGCVIIFGAFTIWKIVLLVIQ